MTHRHARPEVLSSIPDEGHCVIEASAGTGKTFTLENMVVDALLRGTPLERILVVTFTEKATREMRERIRNKIGQVLAPPLDDPERVPLTGDTWLIDDVAANRLRAAQLAFDRAPISTIHAFCQRVLTEHAFEGRRPFEQEAVAPREAFNRAFRDELRRALGERGQLAGVLEQLVSGGQVGDFEKNLFKWCTERGTPEPALDLDALARALEGVRRAAVDERVVRELAAAQAFSSSNAADRLAGLVDLAKAVEPVPTADDLARIWEWMDASLGTKESNRKYLRGTAMANLIGRTPALHGLLEHALQVVTHAASPWTIVVQRFLPRVRARLDTMKARAGQLDFDDMLAHLDESLAGEAGASLVRELRSRFDCALVDEFQDTDEIQWSIFRRLFFEEGSGRRLVVIGDPKQAIYSFRNADVHTYLAARREILERGGTLVPLVQCHRATPRLVDATNRVLASGFFTGDNRYDQPVVAANASLRAVDAAGRDVAPFVLVQPACYASTKLTRDDIVVALAEHAAIEIRRLVGGPDALSFGPAGAERSIEHKDVFVLTRTLKEGKDVGEVLRRHGIPFSFFRQEGLFATNEAMHIADLLDAIADPTDRSLRCRAWLTPFFDVPLEDLSRCHSLAPSDPLVERLHRWRALASTHEFAHLFESIVEESGLVRRLLAFGPAERELTNYMHVLEILLEHSHRTRLAIEDLVRVLRDWIAERSLPPGIDAGVMRLEREKHAVQLLTMHKAKGLEAAVVFVIGGFWKWTGSSNEPRVYHEGGRRRAWIDEPPADVKDLVKQEDQEESERLVYVAMTRAKARVYVPYLGDPPRGSARVGLSYKYTPLGVVRALHRVLPGMVATGALDEHPELFERHEAMVPPERGVTEAHVTASASALLPPALLTPVDEALDAHAELRRVHAGFEITSYTRLARARDPVALEASPTEEFAGEVVESAVEELGPDELRPGSATGIYLHELLEVVDYAAVLDASSFEVWAKLDGVRAMVTAAALRNGMPDTTHTAALAIVWKTLRAPLSGGGLVLPGGLATIARRAAEMPLLYPIPERVHPALGREVDRPLVIDRGFIRGVVDLVFEHGERTWFLDWKSDLLPSYDADALALHVSGSYALQARLYTLGVARMLRIRDERDWDARFGGLLYCFVRAMGEGQGVHFDRPSFADVRAWDRELRESETPFGAPLPHRRASGGAR